MPDWRKDETGNYHNNDFFGGNIKGIEEKLEYLKKLKCWCYIYVANL